MGDAADGHLHRVTDPRYRGAAFAAQVNGGGGDHDNCRIGNGGPGAGIIQMYGAASRRGQARLDNRGIAELEHIAGYRSGADKAVAGGQVAQFYQVAQRGGQAHEAVVSRGLRVVVENQAMAHLALQCYLARYPHGVLLGSGRDGPGGRVAGLFRGVVEPPAVTGGGADQEGAVGGDPHDRAARVLELHIDRRAAMRHIVAAFRLHRAGLAAHPARRPAPATAGIGDGAVLGGGQLQ